MLLGQTSCFCQLAEIACRVTGRVISDDQISCKFLPHHNMNEDYSFLILVGKQRFFWQMVATGMAASALYLIQVLCH